MKMEICVLYKEEFASFSIGLILKEEIAITVREDLL